MGVPCASFPSSSQGLRLYCSLDGCHSVTLESLQEAQGADQDQGGSQTERQAVTTCPHDPGRREEKPCASHRELGVSTRHFSLRELTQGPCGW